MKKYFLGLLSGILIMTILIATPTLAASIQAVFNEIALNIDGKTQVTWGENYTLENGTDVPYSIMYDNTTYLPLRKISEIFGKSIHWNGDSKTVSLTEPLTTLGWWGDPLAEEPDKYGNIWRYTVQSDNNYTLYLVATDNERGFERFYKIPYNGGKLNQSLRRDCPPVFVEDDGIYFMCYDGNETGWHNRHLNFSFRKITFLNDENSQDGEIIWSKQYVGKVIFDGDYIYYSTAYPGMTTSYDQINVCNWRTCESDSLFLSVWNVVTSMRLSKNDDGETTLIVDIDYMDKSSEKKIRIFKGDTPTLENTHTIDNDVTTH